MNAASRYGLLLSALLMAASAAGKDEVGTVAVLWNGPEDEYSRAATAKVAASVARLGQPSRFKVVGRSMGPDPGSAPAAFEALTRSAPLTAAFVISMDLARQVQRLAPGLPIVFDGSADPLQMCLAASLTRPGGSATGASSDYPAEPKALEALRDAYVGVKTVWVLVDGMNLHPAECETHIATRERAESGASCTAGPADPLSLRRVMALAPAWNRDAQRSGIQMRFLVLCDASDFARLRTWIDAAEPGLGILVPLHWLFFEHSKALVQALTSLRLPSIYLGREFLAVGAPMALVPIEAGARHEAAIDLLLQVLRGRSPADLPVQLPRGFKLWINHDAITAPHLRPSLKALRRADGFVGTPR